MIPDESQRPLPEKVCEPTDGCDCEGYCDQCAEIGCKACMNGTGA